MLARVAMLGSVLILLLQTTSFAAGTNLVKNSGVEGNGGSPPSWSQLCGTVCALLTWDSTTAHGGTRSLKIQGSASAAGGMNGAWTTPVTLTKDKVYRLLFYYKASSKQYVSMTAALDVAVTYPGASGPLAARKLSLPLKSVQTWAPVRLDEFRVPDGAFTGTSTTVAGTVSLELTTTGPDDSSIWFDDIELLELAPPSTPRHGGLLASGTDFSLWTESASQRIYEDDLVPAAKTQKIVLSAGRADTEPFQLAVRPSAAWDAVAFDWTDFVGTGGTLPRARMSYRRVEYLTFTAYREDFNRSCRIPDPLPAETSSALRAARNTPFWFLVEVPEGTAPGVYTSQLSLRRGATVVATVPVELTVWRFALPARPRSATVSNLWLDEVMDFEFVDGKPADPKSPDHRLKVMQRYFADAVAHRSEPFSTVDVPITIDASGHAVTDTGALKSYLQILKQAGGRCEDARIPVGFALGKTAAHNWTTDKPPGWTKPDAGGGAAGTCTYLGCPIFADAANLTLNPEFERVFREHMNNVIKAMAEVGCGGGAPLIKFMDEPDVTDQPLVNAISTIGKLIRSIDPKLRPFCSGRSHRDFFTVGQFGRWDFYGASWLGLDVEELELARALGAKTIYQNFVPAHDMAILRPRLFEWEVWRNGFQGAFNWWSITYWSKRFCNVVPNPFVEAGSAAKPTGWTSQCDAGSCAFTWDTSTSVSGSHSLRIQGGTGSWRASFAAEAGQEYRLKLAYRAKAQGTGAKLSFAILDGSGAKLASKEVTLVTTGASCSGECCNPWVTVALPRVPGATGTFTVVLGLAAADSSAVWFDDIAVEPYDLVSGDCSHYTKLPFNPWDLKDYDTGNLLYPPRTPSEPGPVSSLRWEMMRQGIEDIEYLTLLSRLVTERRSTAPADQVAAGEAALKRLDEVTSGMPYNGDLVIHTLDATLVDQVRAAIGRAIDALWVDPGPASDGRRVDAARTGDGTPVAGDGPGAVIEGGCGCRLQGPGGRGLGALLLGVSLLGLLAAWRRARRRG